MSLVFIAVAVTISVIIGIAVTGGQYQKQTSPVLLTNMTSAQHQAISSQDSTVTAISSHEHCTQDIQTLSTISKLENTNAPSVSSHDENIRLTLFTQSQVTTQYENESFAVVVEDNGNHSIVFPEISGEQYSIAFYDGQGKLIFVLGGHQESYPPYGVAFNSLQKPACEINPGDDRAFYVQTRIGNKDHQTPNVLFASASIEYMSNGKSGLLTTVQFDKSLAATTGNTTGITGPEAQLGQNPTNLLKVVVNPVPLPDLSQGYYFQGSLALPHVPKVGEEQTVLVIAKTTNYQGNYSVQVFLPEGVQFVSGQSQKQGYFFPDKYIGMDGMFVVKPVEQEALKMIIKPVRAGNFAIKAVTYADFNGTLLGNEDIIWFSTSRDNSSSNVGRIPLPNSSEPSLPTRLTSIQPSDPIPKINLAIDNESSVHSYGAALSDFCWSDTPKWNQENGASFISICDFANPLPFVMEKVPIAHTQITLTNETTVHISISNLNARPSLLFAELYSYDDFFQKNQEIGRSFNTCIIYSPTSGLRTGNQYEYCPVESKSTIVNDTSGYKWVLNSDNEAQSYETSITTHKSGEYILGVYAQWASDSEIASNFGFKSVYYQFDVLMR